MLTLRRIRLLVIQSHVYTPEHPLHLQMRTLSPTPVISSALRTSHPGVRWQGPPLFGYLAAAEALRAVVTLLKMSDFSFAQHRRSLRDTSARHYGMTADTRCVFTASPRLFAIDLWKRNITDTPTVKLPPLLNVAAIKVRGSRALPFFFSCLFSCSVGFSHSSLW